ncbi:hypothetical protein ACS0TY_031117 [Phlomoides rotata]
MDAGKKSPLSSFKSKKHLHSPAPLEQKTPKISVPNPDQSPWSVRTPGKKPDPPRRLRNRGTALSIKDIRQAASRLRERESALPERTDPELSSEVELTPKRNKSVAAEIELPEKYELLEKFFNSLDCSIRLLQLKRSNPTFSNISPQIETLTDRRFTYNHLAQLKFIMPEAIVLEKVLQYDERTCCMKPDLRITINVEAVETKGKLRSHTGNLLLRKVFRSRVLDFFKSHPEGDDIPEESLPESFNRLKENASPKSAQPSVATSVINEKRTGLTVTGSLLPPSFKRSFSKRGGSGYQTEKPKQYQKIVSFPSVHLEDESSKSPSTSEVAGDSDSKLSLKQASELTSNILETPVKCIGIKGDQFSDEMLNTPGEMAFTPAKLMSVLETPVKCIGNKGDQFSDGILNTPVEMASTPAKLMSATPALRPPKRCPMTPDDISFSSPSKLVRRPPTSRPLRFDTPVKSARRGNSSSHDDILSGALLQSIQEKERAAAMEQDPAISQARRRQQMIANLPKLFNTISYYFRSIKRSVVPKEELVQKLISQLNIADKGEVEEQLRLLQELAPEWIYEKTGLSGDLLLW